MSKPLVIIGASGNASDVLDVVEAINEQRTTWDVLGVLDDQLPRESDFWEFKVFGTLSDASRFPTAWFINAIGSDRSFRARGQIIGDTGLPPERYATLIHPAAAVSLRAELGRGVLVNHGVTIAGGVRIGHHVSVGPGSIIGHNTTIDELTILAPGAVVSGFVHIEGGAYIGARSVIRQNQTIGRRALVGTGAVVTKDVSPHSTVIGCPARPIHVSEVTANL